MKGRRGRHDSKEDPIWILLHGVRHNKHGRWLALLLALSWSASSYPVRNPSPTLFRLALPREVDLRRSATPRSSAPLREREEKTERERELCACVTFARGVARFVKKASGGDARVALHLGHGDTAQPVCPRCAARARADYASPFTVHQHLRLLRANTPTGIIPIVPALSSLSQQPHVQHTHTHTHNTHISRMQRIPRKSGGKKIRYPKYRKIRYIVTFFSFSS